MAIDQACAERFDEYIDILANVVGHADRRAPLVAYCSGLILPGERKSVEPMAARIAPENVRSKHQSMNHFVSESNWSDEEMLRAVRNYALGPMLGQAPLEAWIVDDTGFPKKGKHSVGVANQYCGCLGKNANSQNAVCISLANRAASLPCAFQLYLPEDWSNDSVRRTKTGVPLEYKFITKWQIALNLIDKLLLDGVAIAPFLGDAGYGNTVAFRDGLTLRGFLYTLGIGPTTTVWIPGCGPLPPPPRVSGRGRPAKNLRRDPENKPIDVKSLAKALHESEWTDVEWREGTKGVMKSRFALMRVRPAHRDEKRSQVREEEWLLIEWPENEDDPTHYWLSTMPATTSIVDLVTQAKLRWRIERDFQELKDEIGLDHFEGRGWRGFHHHASLCIATYGFIVAERARLSPPRPCTIFGIEESALPKGPRWRRDTPQG
jgi:SRSO17 transposase